jgi:phosphoribosyl 1,2-cyclic phosphate phosphodiesterase
MTAGLRITILGCGSSPGVPRITGDWGECDPSNPKNRRTRPAAMVERTGPRGTTRVIIDTGPDFRQQMLSANVRELDAVVYTHAHADHIHGIDDLRSYYLQRGLIDVYADAATLRRLHEGFGYCFETPPGSSYPPIVKAHRIEHFKPFEIDGAGGTIRFEPLPQIHGDILSLALRIENFAYCSDASDFPKATAERLRDLELLVIDALQYRTHPSHFSLGEALAWINRLKPARAVLTHMHVPLDYETVLAETPPHVEPAYDGMILEL